MLEHRIDARFYADDQQTLPCCSTSLLLSPATSSIAWLHTHSRVLLNCNCTAGNSKTRVLPGREASNCLKEMDLFEEGYRAVSDILLATPIADVTFFFPSPKSLTLGSMQLQSSYRTHSLEVTRPTLTNISASPKLHICIKFPSRKGSVVHMIQISVYTCVSWDGRRTSTSLCHHLPRPQP